MNSGNNPDVVHTKLDDILYTSFDYDQIPGIAHAENPIIFIQDKTEKQKEHMEEFSGVGQWEAHDEEEYRKIATVRTANEKVLTVVNYKKTLKFPDEFMEDEMHKVVNNAVKAVGFRGRTTRDEKALFIYTDGFASTTTADGVALWSNSHTSLSGDTIDTLETGALSPANLEILVRKLMEQKSQDNELGGHNPLGLLVPPILFPDTNEITKSEKQANTTDNNLNYFSQIYPGLQIFTNPYIGSTYASAANANTSYYLVSQNHSITRYVRRGMKTTLVSPDTDDRDRWTYKASFREVVGPISWEGAVASNGTA